MAEFGFPMQLRHLDPAAIIECIVLQMNRKANYPMREKHHISDTGSLSGIVFAAGEKPVFACGNKVRILNRSPVGHYRVPTYLRGKFGTVETVIEPAGLDNEEEAYGRNAGSKLHYYRIAIPMTEIWPEYAGSPRDGLRIEIYETWLERV